MTKIQCQDKRLSDQDLTAFGNELNQNGAKLQTPLKCSDRIKSIGTEEFEIEVYDPVIEFDESKVSKDAIESIMNKFRFKERPKPTSQQMNSTGP